MGSLRQKLPPSRDACFAQYLRDETNIASATQISECWRLAHDQYSRSAPVTVRALWTLMPADMSSHIDAEIMETLYDEDEAISDFL
jgi:hypothetical protein